MGEEKSMLGITVKKNENFSDWYTQVVLKSGLADYAPVKGCMIFLPYGYAIWNNIRKVFTEMIEDEVDEVYFPIFIPKSILEKEAEHFEGFTPEVAWVTKGGKKDLDEWLAVRPTSETIMYSYFPKIIKSWRDLPLRIIQWVNVVRWETKATRLFFRSREFLWHEGHTCHATKEEADEEVIKRLKQYKKLLEEYLAIPVIDGYKSEGEKFKGALYTTTVEAMMPDGKALQSGTSHNLGQNFSKVFGIKFMDRDETHKYVWQTSWGLSTRVIGAVVAIHGDDKGLVIPPRIAPIQVIIIPIYYKEEQKKMVIDKVKEIEKKLKENGIRAKSDTREEYTPGFKFNEWELKGVPLRIEIGPRDIEKSQVTIKRRDRTEKIAIKEVELLTRVHELLEDIQKSLYEKAKKFMESRIIRVDSYEKMKEFADKGYFIEANHCGDVECEKAIDDETGLTIRVIPFENSEPFGDKKCVRCGKPAKFKAYFAKSY